MDQQQTARRRTRTNLWIDLGIFGAFLVAMSPHVSGLAVHEWLSIAFGAAIVAHLVLHWQWIVSVTRRLVGKLPRSTRANYVLNALLFIDMTIVMLSGLMISEDALPLLGIQTTRGGVWHGLHESTANLALVLIGLHVAVHWTWIVGAIKRFVIAPLALRRRASATTQAQQIEQEA